MMERIHGENKDNIDISIAMNNLALVKQDQGLLVEAEILFRNSLDMFRRIFGPDV